MFVRQVFDENLAEYAYIIGCQRTGEALVIDPERDIDRYVDIAAEEGLRIVAVAETHIHADFLSGAREFAEAYGTTSYLSDQGDADWKYQWIHDGDYDVTLLKHGDVFNIGHIAIEAVHTPGHTPEHMSFVITDHGGGADEPMAIASGDFVFVGDLGRPDLLESAAGVEGAMEPSARRLYESAKRFLELPDYMQVWPGHGAGSACGKALGAVPETTVGYERRFSPALKAVQDGEQPFVDFILDGQPEPPIYFARMKSLNKIGAPVLGGLPVPRRLSVDELRDAANHDTITVVDTRESKEEFYAGHLPGSIHAPVGKRFSGFVGSYVEPTKVIYVIAEEDEVEEAVRNFVRIGYDRIEGFATAADLQRVEMLASIPTATFSDVAGLGMGGGHVLDVRGVAEHRESHVPGSTNVAHTRLAKRMAEVPTEGPLYVHCKTGGRVSGATSYLKSRGYDVVAVDDAFENWAGAAAEAAGTAA